MEQDHQKCTKYSTNTANQYDQPTIADAKTRKEICQEKNQ